MYEGRGAASRVDNKTRICNECGLRESMLDYEGTPLTPPNQPLPSESDLGRTVREVAQQAEEDEPWS